MKRRRRGRRRAGASLIAMMAEIRPRASDAGSHLAQDFAFAGVVGGADDAVFFHSLDQARGAVVADLELPLDEAGRGLPFAQNDLDRLAVEAGVLAFLLIAAEAKRILFVFVLRHLLDIGRLALRLQVLDDLL